MSSAAERCEPVVPKWKRGPAGRVLCRVAVALCMVGIWCCGAEPRIEADFNHVIPRPAWIGEVTEADFPVNPDRIRSLPEFRPVFGSRERFLAMAEFLRSDPAGREIWRSELQRSAIIERINTWRMPRYSGGYTSFWAHYRMPLMRGALVYFFTGNRAAGEFVRSYMLHAMSLPEWYWFSHFAFRDDFERRRMAFLSNAEVARMTVYVLTFAGDLFSPPERALIEKKLRENGIEAILSFFRYSDLFNNFHAVLGSGLFLAARALGDSEAEALAKEKLACFINNGFFSDGSYGEGYHYALYALEHLRWAFEAMDDTERKAMFGASPLAGSARWLDCFIAEKKLYPKQRSPYKTLHGDANYFGGEQPLVFYWLADFWNDSVAGALGRRTGRGESWWVDGIFTLLTGSGFPPPEEPPPLPSSPVCFESGDNFIRRNDGEAPVSFNLCCIDTEKGTLHHHKRPENGSFTLSFNNFPVVVSAGNTNLYGSDLHRNYAMRTAAANTVTIDGGNQRAPKLQRNRIIGASEDGSVQFMALDCRSGWENLEKLERLVLYFPIHDAIVISDAVVSGDPVLPRSHLHLNNVRHDSRLEQRETGCHVYFNRFVEMVIGCSSGEEFIVERKKGFTVSELFAPGALTSQRGEEQRGNVFSLEFGPAQPVTEARLTMVLIPHLPGKSTPVFSISGNRVTVGKYTIEYDEAVVRVSSPDESPRIFSFGNSGEDSVPGSGRDAAPQGVGREAL